MSMRAAQLDPQLEKVGAIPGVWPDKGLSSFLASGQANHTNPVAWGDTESVLRKTKKAPEHI